MYGMLLSHTMAKSRILDNEAKQKDETKKESTLPPSTTPPPPSKTSTEPQRSYLWEVMVDDVFDEFGAEVTFFAKATAIPTVTNETIKRYFMGVPYSYPSRDVSPRIFRITCWDNQKLDAYRYFSNWIDLMQYGENNSCANPVNYLRDIRLRLLASNGTDVTMEVVMKDSFPTEITEVSLTYMESNEVTFDVMFNFSRKVM